MKKLILLTLTMLSCAGVAMAQDLIITKEGDVMKAWGVEVSSSAVFYRESEADDGAIKRIDKSELLMIKYQDGRKEIIDSEAAAPSAQAAENTAQDATQSAPEVPPFGVNPNLTEDNNALIQRFNSTDLRYTAKDAGKESYGFICVLGLKEGSIIETPELSATFSMKRYIAKKNQSGISKEQHIDLNQYYAAGYHVVSFRMVVTLRNKTDKTLYVDLANSFVINDGITSVYYTPTATTVTTGRGGGVGVNLGAVASAAGVGGIVGTLAQGVGVNRGSYSETSTTTYSQRIVVIPPMASVALSPMSIGEERESPTPNARQELRHKILDAYIPYLLENGFFEQKKDKLAVVDLKRGQKIDIPANLDASPLSVHITYSFCEDVSVVNSMRMNFCLRQIMGFNNMYGDMHKDIDYSDCPLIFSKSPTDAWDIIKAW